MLRILETFCLTTLWMALTTTVCKYVRLHNIEWCWKKRVHIMAGLITMNYELLSGCLRGQVKNAAVSRDGVFLLYWLLFIGSLLNLNICSHTRSWIIMPHGTRSPQCLFLYTPTNRKQACISSWRCEADGATGRQPNRKEAWRSSWCLSLPTFSLWDYPLDDVPKKRN